MEIYDYETAGGKNLILDYIDKLPVSTKTQLLDMRNLIRVMGLAAFDLLNTRQLYQSMWEIKLAQERVMYVIRDKDSVFFLHICKKQKGKAEKKHLDLAKRRAKSAGLL